MSVGPMFARRLSGLFALVVCMTLLSGRSGQAQFVTSANTPRPRVAPATDKASTKEVSVGLFGQFTPTRSPNTFRSTTGPAGTDITNFDTRQTTSSSAGIEATFHQQFSRYMGYNVDLGYSRFAEKYGTVDRGSTVVPGYIPTNGSQSFGINMYEVGATAVIEGPRTRRLSTSAETGVSVLTFLPTVRPSDLHLQFRPALAFGIGVNYKLNSYLSTRIAYKGLFYQNPEFRSPGTIIGDAQFLTVTSEPTISLTYTLGKRRKSR